SYADPVDESGIESAAPLAGGKAAVAFRQLRYQPATGLAAFPDGGVPRYLQDSEIVAVLSPDHAPRVLQRIRNPGVSGTLHVSLRATAADPDHFILIRSHQPRGEAAPVVSWTRVSWRDGSIQPYPNFAAMLKRSGRAFGSPEFGDLRVLD